MPGETWVGGVRAMRRANRGLSAVIHGLSCGTRGSPYRSAARLADPQHRFLGEAHPAVRRPAAELDPGPHPEFAGENLGHRPLRPSERPPWPACDLTLVRLLRRELCCADHEANENENCSAPERIAAADGAFVVGFSYPVLRLLLTTSREGSTEGAGAQRQIVKL